MKSYKPLKAIAYNTSSYALHPVLHCIKEKHPEIRLYETDSKETLVTFILNDPPDFLILYHNEPRFDAIAFIAELRNEDISIPFMLVVPDHNEEIFRKAIDLGCFDCLQKNESFDTVNRSLSLCKHRLLRWKQKETEHDNTFLIKKFDELTGVFNRREFIKHLSHGEHKSILLLNIDDFGLINSTYGLEVGDYILKHTASLLKGVRPDNAFLYRIAGDEFVILLEEPQEHQDIILADHILGLFQEKSFLYKNLELKLSLTIGIARGNDEMILRNADIALRRAREIGKNRYSEYYHDADLEEKQKENLGWASRIRCAIEQNRLVPYFQPIINNQNGKIEKYECLARMIDNNMVIPPAHFLEPAKKAGLLSYLTKNMIVKSFDIFQHNSFDFSINISDIDLKNHYLVQFISDNITAYRIKPCRLIIELSEKIQSKLDNKDIQQINELKDIGIKIAFDDFGTGHSNFSRLLDFNPDFIKIDGSFIRYLDKNGKSFKISYTISQFGKSIDTEVIAEYVHCKEVFDKVKELGIPYSQGYYFGRPSESIPR
ncbi:MAG: GGDEF domain-containing response regulator [Spirochaetales bacterium]|nr:GGDEF domain-containing response regulator [Spirochaetales bacterium]